MSCTPTARLDICPDQNQVRTQLLTVLPRGRAWGGSEGPQPDSVLWRFWNAVAAARVEIETRICALIEEFFCATARETRDRWLAEYGLPDACEPYPDLCAKVAAQPGARCLDLVVAAAAAGWSVACLDTRQCGTQLGPQARMGRMRAGGGRIRGTIILAVDLAASPAYNGSRTRVARAGRLRAGQRLACPPDLSSLECLLGRIAPAHGAIVLRPRTLGARFDFAVPGNPLIALL